MPNGGSSLSGGQRQLLAATAAIASGRPLILLDEFTANLDAKARRRLRDLVKSLPATVVLAGHEPEE